MATKLPEGWLIRGVFSVIKTHTFRKQPMPGGKSRVVRPADGPTVEQENMCEELKREKELLNKENEKTNI